MSFYAVWLTKICDLECYNDSISDLPAYFSSSPPPPPPPTLLDNLMCFSVVSNNCSLTSFIRSHSNN